MVYNDSELCPGKVLPPPPNPDPPPRAKGCGLWGGWSKDSLFVVSRGCLGLIVYFAGWALIRHDYVPLFRALAEEQWCVLVRAMHVRCSVPR